MTRDTPPEPRPGEEPAPEQAAPPAAAAPPPAEEPPGQMKVERKPPEFDSFAPAAEPAPGRGRRIGSAFGRGLRHEWTWAAVFAVALSVVMTWPTMRYPLYTIPNDVWDPTLQAWQMAWSGHAMLHNPLGVWDSNTFFPEDNSFAFSDTLLGYFPAGMIGTGPVAALLRYNIMFVLVFALAFFGVYALARQLGSRIPGAVVAGAICAYAPWRWDQAGHMHVLSTGGIALSLAMLARGHGYSLRRGYRPELRKPGWVLAGWLVAAWQISLGFGIGLPFAYVIGIVAVTGVIAWLLGRFFFWSEPKPFGWKLLSFDLVGGLVFAAVGVLMAIPYFQVVKDHPYAERSFAEVGLYSPPILGFFTAPGKDWLWGDAHQVARDSLNSWGGGEMTLLVGFTAYGLAVAGLIYSSWKWWQRVLLFLGVVVSVTLAMGTRFLDGKVYQVLYDNLPGWNAIRTPGRLVVWTTLLLAILGAGAVTAFGDRAAEIASERDTHRKPHPVIVAAMLIPLVLVLLEGRQQMDFPTVRTQPAAMATMRGPALILPSDQLNDENIMLWSTDRFEKIVNGGSGFTPQSLEQTREIVKTFPDQPSVDYLRNLGVQEVIVLRNPSTGAAPDSALNATGDGLGIKREDHGDEIVFYLNP
ncbi:hypothetical protein [Hamadaea tsunoensis]|uniref:hypothetical protein n=1 Tax=Hamadaea tsunoensis TaxID=53368 RepID=UPI0012FB7B2E|nr:hypothetical protein [Hamadaea tsunoensis]